MKRYVRSNNTPKNYYDNALKREGRYTSFDTVGQRTLYAIQSLLKYFPNSETTTYIPKRLKDMQTVNRIVVKYCGTQDQLQKDVCKIIRDAGKLEDLPLSPRSVGNQVRYRPYDGYGKPADKMVVFTFTKITYKITEKFDFDFYLISL